MPLFHWEYTQQQKWIAEKARDDAYRDQVRQNLHPQASEIVSHLVTDYPWLSPGVVASIAQVGMDPSSPLVTAVARLDFQRRSTSGDWGQPGDKIRPKFTPEPPPLPTDPDSQPMLPPVAPSPQSPAANEAVLNSTPQPAGGATPPPGPPQTPPPAASPQQGAPPEPPQAAPPEGASNA